MEYILLVTAVLAVIIVLVVGNNSPLQNQLNSALNSAVSQINSEAGYLSTSHDAHSAPTGTAGLPNITINIEAGLNQT